MSGNRVHVRKRYWYRHDNRTGLGATESAPFALTCPKEINLPGAIGLPVPGVELKLVPSDDKLEARVRARTSPPGTGATRSLRARPSTRRAIIVSATRALRGAGGPNKASCLMGAYPRISSSPPAHGSASAPCAPLSSADLPVCQGRGRRRPRPRLRPALIFPYLYACRAARRRRELSRGPAPARGVSPAPVRRLRRARRPARPTASSASSLLAEPPSLDAGEITDKGTINQRATLASPRRWLVAELYNPESEAAIRAR